MSIFRPHCFIPGKGNCKIADTSGAFMCNSLFDNFGHINGFYCERKQLCDRANHVFLNDVQADARQKMGFHEWSNIPRG